MKAYIFQAALICSHCAEQFMASNPKPSHVDMDDESSYDSDHWPKGPYGEGGGEADSPQHCDHCGVFLENPLTPDGDAWLRAQAEPFASKDPEDGEDWEMIADKAEKAGKPVLRDWIMFYLSWGGC